MNCFYFVLVMLEIVLERHSMRIAGKPSSITVYVQSADSFPPLPEDDGGRRVDSAMKKRQYSRILWLA